MIVHKPHGGSHGGDTFRELLDMWEEEGYCFIEQSPNDYVWVDSPGNILLYDYPRLDDRPIPPFKYGLFGNTIPKNENCFSWIFWGRKPRKLEKEIESGIISYEERKYSKFGLTLPGYGPKCNREIEYLGLGTVPIFVDGCDINYYNTMKEDVHYIIAKDPLELKEKVESISKNEWNELSNNGRMWYNKNCSRKGSFEVTKRIIEEMDLL